MEDRITELKKTLGSDISKWKSKEIIKFLETFELPPDTLSIFYFLITLINKLH